MTDVQRKLIEFIHKHRMQFRQYEIRPWGGFQLALSLDGHQWYITGQAFGSAFSLQDAACQFLQEQAASPSLEFYDFLHSERFVELKRLCTANTSTKKFSPETVPSAASLANPLLLLPSSSMDRNTPSDVVVDTEQN